MTKAAEREITLKIKIPRADFPKCMYFNRFRVERDEGSCLVQFGLVVGADLVDSYSCFLTPDVLHHNRDTLMKYLRRVGRSGESSRIPWKGPPGSRATDVADIITMAYRGNTAESCLYAFSLYEASRSGEPSEGERSLSAQPLVLLRCSADLQKHLIESLYEQ